MYFNGESMKQLQISAPKISDLLEGVANVGSGKLGFPQPLMLQDITRT